MKPRTPTPMWKHGQRLTLQSGADTTLKGAVAKDQQVTANVGGNLNAQSLQLMLWRPELCKNR